MTLKDDLELLIGKDSCDDCPDKDDCDESSTTVIELPANIAMLIGDKAIGEAMAYAIAHRSEEKPPRMVAMLFTIITELHNNLDAFHADKAIKALGTLYAFSIEQQGLEDGVGETRQ